MRKKDKGFRKELIMPLFIAMIMIMSVFGYMWGSGNTKFDYNGHKFYYIDQQGYILKTESGRFGFNYYPTELAGFNASPGIGNLFNGPMAYAAYSPDSEYSESIAELQYNLGQVLFEAKGVYVQNAFTSENEYNMPVVACANATSFVPVVIIEKSNATSITKQGSCVLVDFKTRQDLFAAYERLLYSILGVME